MNDLGDLAHQLRRLSRRWWVVAVVQLLIALVCFALGLPGERAELPGPSVPSLTQSEPRRPVGPSLVDPTPRPPARVAGPRVARSAPVALRITSIGLSTSMTKLGLNPDGTVEVPADPDQPGWFRLGPSPGQPGSAVILGHVDSYTGPAVFLMLRFVQPGDQVEVTLADGVVARFVVRSVATYPNAQFPAKRVYGSHGHSALQLVTCGGDFDTATQRYLSNVVVYTTLVSTAPKA